MKQEAHIFQGMKRDNHPTLQQASFLWDALNIRINRKDGDTYLAITNERGNNNTNINIEGDYVGHCVLDKYLVIFTVKDNNSYIYRVQRDDNTYTTILLYKGALGFSQDYPIEALGVMETNLLYKVYWIDGNHQPRFIIITTPEYKNVDIIDGKDYTNLYNENLFDFVGKLQLDEEVTITKNYGSGIFSPGVIQYAFTYFNKYGQESNIFYTTPLQYISFSDRAGNPEDRIACSFKIDISKLDKNFNYLRVYSIHRTSIDAVPTVLQLPDIEIDKTKTETETSVSITDTGNIGTTVDPTKLLYIGGREFIPQTFAAKDGTLFFGDIELIAKDTQVLEELNKLNRDSIIQNVDAITRQWEYSPATFYIEEKNRLDNGYNALFKTNETYRIGIQAQLSNGTWSQPVFIADKILNTRYPSVEITDTPSLTNNIYTIKQYTGAINIESIIDSLKGKGVKKLRACVVFPATYEREVICQGVINPTVYNAYFRSENAPFTQSSWFFRPTVIDASKGLKNSLGKNIQHTHNKPLGASVNSASGYTKEIQSMSDNTPLDKITSPKQKNSNFYIDENIVTFHSPDIEFDDNTWQLDYRGCKLKVLGYVELNSIYGDANITTSTPTRGNKSNGFVHSIVGYNGKMPIGNRNNGGMVSHPLYYDTAVNENGEIIDKYYGYTIYPWHRGTSLNNDIANTADDKRVRSAMLKTKVMSNLKFFNKYTPINHFNGSETSVMDIETPQLFNSEETTILKQDIDYLHPAKDALNNLSGIYWGNVDSLIAPSTEYKIDTSEWSVTPASKDPIRIKYKSTPHLMFKFKQPVKEGGYPVQVLIPRHVDAPDPGTWIDYPKWIIEGDPYDDIPDDEIMENEPNYKGIIDVIGVRIYTDQSSGDLYNAYNYTNKTCYGLLNDGTTPFLGKVLWNNETHIYDFTPVEAGIYKIEGPPTLIYLLKTIDSEEDKGIFPIDQFFSPEEYSVTEDQDEHGNTVTRYEVLITNTQKNYVQWDGDHLLPSQRPSYAPSIKTSTSSTGTIRVEYSQPTFGIKGEGSDIAPYLLLVELTKEIDNKYGGESPDILQSHMWIPASDAVTLDSLVNKDGTVNPIKLMYGDTWYERYDCLKTYPFTREDQNQVVEIGSFMCETRVNLNGRYDRNKGELSCLQMSPANFNLLNKVYNQKDNFFNYKILDKDANRLNHFPYQFTWSLQKINGDSTDAWTNISLANVSDMDGAYGKLTKLVTFNDALFAFQEKALSAIAFNSRVQIPTSDGVPIEISNSYKVDGSKLINSYIGCYDKWAIESSPYGVYFFDKYSQSLYLYNGELTNLSDTLGMKHWVSLLNKDSIWKPKSSVSNGIRIFYDPNYKDVYFTPGPGSDIPALCYSEELKQFSSLLSYNGTEAMFPWGGNFYSLHKTDKLGLWHNFVGDYNYIYEDFNPYYISFISNENPLITKVFDVVEYQAGLYQDGTELYDKPFNKVEAFNEYQESSAVLDNMNTRKKFRIWRTNIPRSSKVASTTSTTGNIDRNRFGRARMRNPWVNIKLTHNNKDTAKLVLSSVAINYSI